MSDWGWHSFPNSKSLKPSESEKIFDFGHGHQEIYAVEFKNNADGRHKEATEYFRVNPHRLHLGSVGLSLSDTKGQPISLGQLTKIRQEQRLYDGEIISSFKADGEQMDVITGVHPTKDALYARLHSPLLKNRQAVVSLRFAYPTGKHADDACDWTAGRKHQSMVIDKTSHSVLIERILDDTKYYVLVQWEGHATFEEYDRHHFRLSTSDEMLSFSVEYMDSVNSLTNTTSFSFNQYHTTTLNYWHDWWYSGAVVDFSLCTDPRSRELERRVVLSQYLTQINCANALPPQESGLTYNTWYGRPHLEMAWWHLVDFILWGHPEVVEKMLQWYNHVAYPVARQIAQRQGFKGVRWMKMTDPWAGEAPSNTGSFLIWQQPHYIYLAEEMYRANPSTETLREYGAQVEATAEFMADFVSFDAQQRRYVLKGATAMQECMTKDISYNHPFELAYWRYGLSVAQQWRVRQGKPRIAHWDDIIAHLSPLPEVDGIYTAGVPIGNSRRHEAFDPFDAPAKKIETFADR
jgi:hypothetical protein